MTKLTITLNTFGNNWPSFVSSCVDDVPSGMDNPKTKRVMAMAKMPSVKVSRRLVLTSFSVDVCSGSFIHASSHGDALSSVLLTTPYIGRAITYWEVRRPADGVRGGRCLAALLRQGSHLVRSVVSDGGSQWI